MKSFPTSARLLAVSVLLPVVVAAQNTPTVPAKSTAAVASPPTDTVVLSPFNVNTDADDSFTATSAGTSTRLALDMKDVPAALQVMTRDFIDALGITNLQEATTWATNGGSIPDGNGQDVFNITFLANMRGVALSGGQQRNNYLTAATLDSYAMGSYEFSRGPNAALFGIGGNTALGGSMGGQTKKPRYDRPVNTISATYGSWNYKRTTFDVNQPLTDRLAIRANAVWFDRGDWRQGGFEKTKGITLAGSYLIGKKTELKIEVADDLTKRNNPQTNLFDNVSGWDGVTVFNGPITNAILGTQTVNGTPNSFGQILTFQGERQGVNRQSSPYYIFSPFSGQNVIMNYQNEGYTRRADETANTPLLANGTLLIRSLTPAGAAALPFGNAGATVTLPALITATSNGGELDLRYQQNLPDDRFARAINGSKFVLPGKRFTNSVNSEIIGQHLRDANLSISHQVGESLFLEVGGDVNQVHDRRMNPNNLRNVRIDINQTLPNGAANSHFLQPYMDSPLVWNNRITTNSTIRGNAAYLKNLGAWGDYTVNFMASANKRNTKNRNYVYSMASLADQRTWQGADEQIRYRYYFNEASRPYTDSGLPASAYKVDWTNGNAPVGTVVGLKPRWVLTDWNDQDEDTKSATLVGSAKFFKGRLILVSGVRYDSFSTKTRLRSEFGDLPTDWDGNTLSYKPAAPDNWRSLTYIPRNATTGVATSTVPIPAATRPRVNTVTPLPFGGTNNGVQVGNPFFANDKFRNDYSNPYNEDTGFTYQQGFVYKVLSRVALTGNYSTAFVLPSTGAFTLNNEVVSPKTGYGYDTGVRFDFGRFSAKVGYFYNVEDHQLVAAPTTGSINGLYQANAATDGALDGRNARGYADIFGSDYQSQKNKGYEFELQGTIMRGWRGMVNVGTGHVDTYNRFPLARVLNPQLADSFKQVLEDAGGRLDTTQKPSLAPNAPGLAVINTAVTPALATERTNAINNYNNIWINNELILNDTPAPGTDRLTVNMFTDYTVQSGRLKGLKLGVGAQYRGRNFLQYRTADTIVSPTNPNLAIDDPELGLNSPVYVKLPTIFTMTVGYNLRLKSRERWSPKELLFQLRIKNLTNNQQVVYQDAGLQARPPGGDYSKPNRVSVPVRIGSYTEPISFLFTTTLKL